LAYVPACGFDPAVGTGWEAAAWFAEETGVPALVAGLFSPAEAGADAFVDPERFAVGAPDRALEGVADRSVAPFRTGSFGDESAETAVSGVAALAVDDGFEERNLDESGAILGAGCLDEASAGP
jgi:hypothetical protein